MFRFLQLLVATVALYCLSACTLMPSRSAVQADKAIEDAVLEVMDDQADPHRQAEIRDYGQYLPAHHHKYIGDYVEQMLMQLQDQLRQPLTGAVAVASFVEFDHTLANTNALGNQIAEAALIEINRIGYPAVDINVADNITVARNGNFIFSRENSAQLDSYCCVLSGNLIYDQRGVIVNAKLVAVENKQLLGAASLTIPYFVVEHLGHVQLN